MEVVALKPCEPASYFWYVGAANSYQSLVDSMKLRDAMRLQSAKRDIVADRTLRESRSVNPNTPATPLGSATSRHRKVGV